MEALGVLILTFLFFGAAESEDFDLSDALHLPEDPQRNHGKEQCSNEARDIVFLIDGSSSVRPSEFLQLKLFTGRVMQSFPEDTQFSLLQFSNRFEEHFDFKYFQANRNPTTLLSRVRQLGGSSYTATGIQKAVRELFTTQKGARSTAKKFLVVLTDGEKTGDPLEYADVTEEANRAGIVRIAVGVGLGFTSAAFQRELHAIASHPATHHAMVVKQFTGLRDIQELLKEKICTSRGLVPTKPAAAPLPSTTCTSGTDPQVLQKLEQVLTALDQLSTKLNILAARQGKCR